MPENYFAVYGIKQQYLINKQQVEANYLKLQQALHPDNFTRDTHMQKLATQKSAMINAARITLLCDVLRAEHLLELQGNKVATDATLDDKDFLQQQFVWNMQINEAETTLEKQTIQEDLANEFNNLTSQFNQTYNAKCLSDSVDVILKMRFVNKLLTNLG
jgi:molecular chaperone HscB